MFKYLILDYNNINIFKISLRLKMSKAPQKANYERLDSKKLFIKGEQAETEVAVVKFADMSERMQ